MKRLKQRSWCWDAVIFTLCISSFFWHDWVILLYCSACSFHFHFCVGSGVGRVGRGQDSTYDVGRDEPCRLSAWNHPRRLLCRSGQVRFSPVSQILKNLPINVSKQCHCCHHHHHHHKWIIKKTEVKWCAEVNLRDFCIPFCYESISFCWSRPEHVCVDSALQECDPRQRLGGERPEGNLTVVSPERASLLGGQQQPLDLQLKVCVDAPHNPVFFYLCHYKTNDVIPLMNIFWL